MAFKCTRRQLFQYGGAAVISLSSLGSILWWMRRNSSDAKWGFLTRDAGDKQSMARAPWLYVKKNFVPVGGNEGFKPQKTAELDSLLQQRIRDGVMKEGWDRNAHYEISATKQVFVVPDDPKHREHIKAYCVQCIDYLYNHPQMRVLARPRFDIVAVNRKDDYTNNWQNKVFVGNSSYTVEEVAIHNTKRPEQISVVGRNIFSEASFGLPKRREDGRISTWYVLLASSLPGTIIKAPFSELIPLSIDDVTLDYERLAGREKGNQAREAISEGLAHVLAIEAVKELGVPNGVNIVEGSLQKIGLYPEYRYVMGSVEWIMQHSMKEALEIYMSSPKEFMQKIGMP